MLVKAQYVERDETDKKKPIISGKDESTHRLLMHPHALRKYFRGYLSDANLAEFLMGHSTNMTRIYDQMKPEDRAKKYLECMKNVTFFSDIQDTTKMTEALHEKEREIAALKSQIETISTENRNHKELIDREMSHMKEIADFMERTYKFKPMKGDTVEINKTDTSKIKF